MLAERDRWALWLPVALGAGVGLYFALPFEPPAALALSLGLAGVLVAGAAATSPEIFAKAAFAVAAAFLIGFGAAKLRAEMVAAPILGERLGPVEMEGRVEFAELRGKGVRAVVALEHVERAFDRPIPSHVRVTFRGNDGRLVPGARIAFRAVLLPPPAPAAPGDYDFARAAYFEGLGVLS